MVKTRSCDLNCGLSLDEMELINFANATACKIFAVTSILGRPRQGAKDPGEEPETPAKSQRPRQRARAPGEEPDSKKLSHRSSFYIAAGVPGKEPETPARSQRPRQRARDPGREPKTPI